LGSILREIKFLRANRHPCIIDVHDAFITANPRVVNIVMHYCESGTLASVISAAKKNKTYIPEAQILKWFIQLLLALNFLHSNQTLHRDLKPLNIMLTEGGELLKIGDFGLAVDLSDSSEDKKNIQDEAGTPYYTAPEMIQRESYSYPADCWSFGIILYQLLTLERPFEGSSTAELVKSILTREPTPILAGHYSDEIK
jgi:NIMA (never in mitosis gene a)-related kinase